MHDQFGYAMPRVWEEFDENARHYDNYVTVAQNDSDLCESLPSLGCLRTRRLFQSEIRPLLRANLCVRFPFL